MSPRTKRIKDLPKSKRPREKLSERGPRNLTAAELLAILIGSGTTKSNALRLAGRILKEFPLKELFLADPADVARLSGLGTVKVGRIQAALELGRRAFGQPDLDERYVHNTEEAVAVVSFLANRRQECLVALYLDAEGKLLGQPILAIGPHNRLLVEPREIFIPALKYPAVKVILAHNHPSGRAIPSRQDLDFAERILAAGKLLGVELLDYLIIAKNDYYSFQENW